MVTLIDAFLACSVEVDITRSVSFFRVRETIRRVVHENNMTVPACFLCCVEGKWFVTPTDFIVDVENMGDYSRHTDNNMSKYVANILNSWGSVFIADDIKMKKVVSPKLKNLKVLKFKDPLVGELYKPDFDKVLPLLENSFKRHRECNNASKSV